MEIKHKSELHNGVAVFPNFIPSGRKLAIFSLSPTYETVFGEGIK